MVAARGDAGAETAALDANDLVATVERLAASVREGRGCAEARALLDDLAATRPLIRRRLATSSVRPLWLVRLDRAIHVLILAVEAQGVIAEPSVSTDVDDAQREAARRLGGRIRLLLAASSTAGVLVATSAAAADCSVVGATVNCVGAPGPVAVLNRPVAVPVVTPGVTTFAGPYTTLNVSGLTTGITAPATLSGLSFQTSGGTASGGRRGADSADLVVRVDASGQTITTNGAIGVFVNAVAGNGGKGDDGYVFGSGDTGGAGGSGGDVDAEFAGGVTTTGDYAVGLQITSQGGDGGKGGAFYGIGGSAGDGGVGGAGGTVTARLGSGTITTTGLNAFGAYIASLGGKGGQGGGCGSLICGSNSGGVSANGGVVTVSTVASTTIQTVGEGADALHVASIGGFAGNGGNNYGLFGFGATGGSAGDGGAVTVTNNARLTTAGDSANALFVQSVGGGGGAGGSSYGLVSLGGGTSQAGDGGDVSLTNTASSSIVTAGVLARGIFAQSVGGGGGTAGSGFGLVGVGGDAAAASRGGSVTVSNAGSIRTTGMAGQGVFAQSVGGGGGDGGVGGGLAGIGGGGGGGGAASAVTVSNTGTIDTGGMFADGIFAQSVGGGGGTGGTSAGVVSIGGSGGGGGDASDVTVTNSGHISVKGAMASGVTAQSIGGGGGDGGGAGSGGVMFNVSIGGSGGQGGSSGKVTVTQAQGASITTSGVLSPGIFAQSVGGGGGTGGFAAGASVGAYFDASVGVGGSGGQGGDGDEVTVTAGGDVATDAADSSAIYAQSVGGGGGAGGFAATGALSGGQVGVSASVNIGGSGGHGGDGGEVSVRSTGVIRTAGDRSLGVFAQSVGGGGGSGGWTGSVGGAAGAVAIGAAVGVGGSGGGGGDGADASAEVSGGSISTVGVDASGVLVQSVGGGGGTGGFAMAAGVGAGNASGGASVGVGGDGGVAGDGAQASLVNRAGITTQGDRSYGALVQSIGGGGGTGGWTGVLAVGAGNNSGAGSVSVGGDGGAGGDAGAASLTNSGAISTKGSDAIGLFVQSAGGGGGTGGFSVSAALAAGKNTLSASISVGGDGGAAGDGDQATLNNTGKVVTQGDRATGLQAQSVGGGGGAGGWTGSLGLQVGDAGAGASVGVGGSGGAGGDGGKVGLTNSGAITTSGVDAMGVFAQSVGGGGGSGGFSVGAGIGVTKTGGAAAVNIGGSGGAAGSADTVNLTTSGDISTAGDRATAVLAQSVGGGGGTGGWTGSVAGSSGKTGGAVAVGVGGSGGAGGDGGAVQLTGSSGSISTQGDDASGLVAQSIGGGGGAGGFSVGLTAASGDTAAAIGVMVGGSGGAAGDGAEVTLNTSQTISTQGDRAFGALAQSVGGGGGSGGFVGDISGALAGKGGAAAIGIGGSGGAGGSAGAVTLTSSGTVGTAGAGAHGVLIQSVGGGGGAGGLSLTGAASKGTNTGSIAFSLGGSGGAGSFAGTATGRTSGIIKTAGDGAHGVLVQSVGGGGGTGGVAGALTGQMSSGSSLSGSIALGGSGGVGATGSTATLTNSASISTAGRDSYGAYVQSVGGGGGSGGFALSAAMGGAKSYNVGFSLGGAGGKGAAAGLAQLDSSGTVTTTGMGAIGLFAQSVGGGGGAGGAGGAVTFGGSDSVNVSVGIGGRGGKGGDSGAVSLTNTGLVSTSGEMAHGVMAQSVGGGGGHGGVAGLDPKDLEPGAGGAGSVTTGQNAKNITLSFGGSGGAAGDAGAVSLKNTGQITTTGDTAHAVYAHSIGGGGGDGGVSSSIAASSKKGKGLNLGVSFGGSGGGGGDGGAVTVDNQGRLSTSGDHSYGLFAFSVGGGGGAGGSVRARAISWSNKEVKGLGGAPMAINVSVGGSGGEAGDGGDVTVTNSGSIATTGANGDGIHAKSVGGGGGDGGDVATLGDDVYDILASIKNKNDARPATINIGGASGASGDGGAVTVVNNGSVSTAGSTAQGIFAQSVGGGGGSGGSGLPGNFNLGGSGGAAGDGGVVKVTNNGGIVTRGGLSAGIFAQSVGGGGGVGGGTDESPDTDDADAPPTIQQDAGAAMDAGPSQAAVDSGRVNWREWMAKAYEVASKAGDLVTRGIETLETFRSVTAFQEQAKDARNWGLGIGGSGGAAGDGGAVTVVNKGSIETFGVSSPGIFAQSVGGGGGFGGEATFTKCCELNVSGAGGAAGAGGNVSVTNTGSITTHGYGSYGIFAQSVGGAGGVAGDTTLGILAWGDLPSLFGGPDYSKALTMNLSVNGPTDGHGGDVTVTNTGDIVLDKAGAVGIFAQSVGGGGGLLTGGAGLGLIGSLGGQGLGGTVTVTQNGDVRATGMNAYGVVLQSTARQGGKNIIATYNGAVQGGGGLGMGALIDGGRDNTITFKGPVSAGSNLAIVSTGGNDTINALGGVRGNVDLGAGVNAFNNGPSSLFETTDYVKLNGGTLTNAGQVSPGGLGRIQTTAIQGGYVQTAGASYLVDLDFGSTPGGGDRLSATGAVDVKGDVRLNLNDIGAVRSGKFSAVLIEGASLTAPSVTLSAPPSAVARFALRADTRSLDIQYDVDFAPRPGLTPNGQAVGVYLNAVTANRAPADLQAFVAGLIRVPTVQALGRIYQSLTPESYLDGAQVTAIAAERFTDSMMSCPTSSEHVLLSEEGCVWLRASDRRLKLKPTATLSAFGERTDSYAAGFERRVSPALRLGVALGVDDLQAGIPQVSDGKGKRYSVGVVAKTEVKSIDVAVAASGGTADMSGQRAVITASGDVVARGEQTVRNVAVAVRASKTLGDPRFYVRPMLELDASAVRMGALNETAPGGVGLTAPAQTLESVSLTPRIEIGGEFMVRDVAVRPFVRAALNRVVSGDRPKMDAALLGAGGLGGDFTFTGQADRQTEEYEVGLQAVTSTGKSARVTWSERTGDRTRSEAFALKFTAPF